MASRHMQYSEENDLEKSITDSFPKRLERTKLSRRNYKATINLLLIKI